MDPQKLAAFQELHKRGALPPEKEAAYQELLKRGEFTNDGFVPTPKYVDNPYMKGTGETSTITGKPVQEPSGVSYEPASMATLAKAGFVDNNDAKIKLFAEARGVSPDKYTVRDGKIWFKADDGNFYPETPKEISNIVKKFIAELPAESLADVGAAGGAIAGGPFGAAGGAAGGELVRKKIGELFFGDQQKPSEYMLDMAVNAVLGGVDAKIARGLAGGLSSRKVKKATGGKISQDFTEAVGDLTPEQRIAGQAVKEKGKGMGIDLLPHQAMDDPALTSYFSLLRDNPKTSRTVRKLDQNLSDQVESASDNLVRGISQNDTDPFTVGDRLTKKADEIVRGMKDARSAKAKPSYDAAYESGAVVDTSNVIDEIGRLKDKTSLGMKSRASLTRIERMLFKEEVVNGKKTRVPVTDIETLDNVKQEIDAILNGKDASSIANKTKRRLKQVKDELTTATDSVSPEYQKARKIFELASPEIEKTEAGIIGTLKNMKTDNVKEAAVNKIFASRKSIREARKRIEKADPQLWKDTVAEYFREGFEKAATSTEGSGGKVINRPGKYFRKVWDTNKKKIKVATEGMTDANGDPLYDRINDFFEVMQKASIGHGKESQTWTRAKMEKDLEGAWGKMASSVVLFRQTLVDIGLKSRQQKAFDNNAQRLLELMQTSEGVDLIAKAKGYGPKTEKGIEAITTLLLMAGQTNVDDAAEAIETYREK